MLSLDLLDHYRRLSQQTFTVVDLETTGHLPGKNRVIEVSVLQATLKDGIQHQQTSLVNPGVRVPPKITRFTGISQAMVEGAPIAEIVWQSFLPLLNQGVLTAHNLEFDYSFLRAEYQRLGTEFERVIPDQLCTVILARLLLPDLPSRSLPDLVQHFGFQVGAAHRAAADTLACWLLAERLLTEIQTEADEVLLARFAREWIPLQKAAEILNCSRKLTQTLLERAGADSRPSHRSVMYRRGEVEEIFWRRGGRQLSLL